MNFKTDFYSVLPDNKYDELHAHALVPSFTAFVPHISSRDGVDTDVPDLVSGGAAGKIILSNYEDFYRSLASLSALTAEDYYPKVEMGLVMKRHSGHVKHRNKESIQHRSANPAWNWDDRLFAVQRHHNYTISWNHIHSDCLQEAGYALDYSWKGDESSYGNPGIAYAIADEGNMQALPWFICCQFMNQHGTGSRYYGFLSSNGFNNGFPSTSSVSNKGPHACVYYGVIFRVKIHNKWTDADQWFYTALSDNSICICSPYVQETFVTIGSGWNHTDHYKIDGKLY